MLVGIKIAYQYKLLFINISIQLQIKFKCPKDRTKLKILQYVINHTIISNSLAYSIV